jgi:RNA polymerase sigma-70 factor, ECF subfamily
MESGSPPHMETRSDATLVHAVIGGDVEAFAPLVHRYRDAYTRFAVRVLGGPEDADDVLQLAFMRAFRSLPRCDEPDRFGAWLYRIVINECRTFATRRGRRARRFVDDAAQLDSIADTRAVEPDVLREEIQRALDLLPHDQREAFVLKHVEDLSYEAMSEITGAGVSALKMRVKRSCERLRELLEGVHHDQSA